MKKSQLNSISKREGLYLAMIHELGLDTVYRNQTMFKTVKGFLNAKPKKFIACMNEALKNIDVKILRYEQLNQTDCSGYGEAIAAARKIEGIRAYYLYEKGVIQ